MPKYINSFRSPEFLEEKILDPKGATIGTIRLKPSSILWKPKNARKFLSVSLDKFAAWISDEDTKARETKS